MPSTTPENTQGLVELREALSSQLRTLDADAWQRTTTDGRTVRELVEHLVGLYAEAAAGTLDASDEHGAPAATESMSSDDLLAAFDRVATRVESHFAEVAEERWDLSVEEVHALGGTVGMSTATLASDVYLHAVEIGRATGNVVDLTETSVDAAAAGVAWRAGEWVETSVHLVLGDGSDYVIGAGEPEGTLRTDPEALVLVATEQVAPTDLEAQGRWTFEGPAEVRRAFEESFHLSFGAR